MSNPKVTPNPEIVSEVKSIVKNNKNITLQELQTQLAAKQERNLPDEHTTKLFPHEHDTELFSVGNLACKAGLNVVVGGLIVGAVAAGAVVGPEAAVVLAIVRFLGGRIAASTVAGIINGAIGGGGGASVEEIISEICSKV